MPKKTAEDDHKSKYAKKQTHFKIQFYIRIHVTKVKKSFCFIQRAPLATAQNFCFGWPSRHILSAASSLKTCYKIEVIVPFIIDFLEGLYILHTVPVVDNVDSDDLWTGDVNPTLRKWRIWLVWEQKNLEMSKSMTNLSIHLVYHSSRDDLVFWDRSMFSWVLPKFIILSRDVRGSISLLRGVATWHYRAKENIFGVGRGREQNPRDRAEKRSTGTTWTTLVPHLW